MTKWVRVYANAGVTVNVKNVKTIIYTANYINTKNFKYKEWINENEISVHTKNGIKYCWLIKKAAN